MSFIKSLTSINTKLLPQSDDSVSFSPSQYSSDASPLMQQFADKSFSTSWKYKSHDDAMGAYTKCPPLAAIINKMAQAYINGKTWVMDKNGKEAKGLYADKLRKLIRNPNPLQSWKQFEAQQQIYIDLFGFCLLLPIIPVGYEKFGAIEASSMWNIPPFMLSIKETDKLFYQTSVGEIISEITVLYRGGRVPLNVDQIYIFKDFVPQVDSLVFPGSRLKSLEMPVNNIIGAYESRNVLINYRGALGVFTQEPNRGQFVNTPLQQKDKDSLQADFKRYGLKNRQWKFIISEAALKWQQIGVGTKDLMLFEEIEDDIMRLCDAYNMPSPLINSATGPSVSNTKEFKAQMYQDGVIPKAEMTYEQWNQIFRTEEVGLDLIKDYSHISVLQEDEKARWDARKSQGDALINEYRNDIITLNRLLFLMGEDTIGPQGDVYYSQREKEKVDEDEVDEDEAGATAVTTTTTESEPVDDND